jgi:hypothetical protein
MLHNAEEAQLRAGGGAVNWTRGDWM